MKRYFLFLLIIFLFPSLGFSQTKIKVVSIQGEIINPLTARYIERGIKKAGEEGGLLIIRMDTPGGLLKSTQEIVKAILNSPVPVVTYVYPKGARAASAGVFIGYASHILAMSPSTHLGAAHPVIGGGKWGSLGKEAKTKILNDTVAWAKNISQARNRPFPFIKDAIEKSISITAEKAKRRKICDLIAEDLSLLIKKIDGETVTTSLGKIKIFTEDSSLEEINLTKRERFLNALIEPNLAYLLLTLGFLGLIFEVTHPGFGFPGIFGIACLILSFYALSILPVNYAGVALIAIGIVFFIVEGFTPAFGIFTLGGVISFGLGSIMLFNQREFMRVSFKVIFPSLLFFSGLSVFFLAKTFAAQRKKSSLGRDGLLGKTAVAYTDINKKGKVFIHGEIWDARSKDKIKKEEEVVVEEIDGLRLVVKRRRSNDS